MAAGPPVEKDAPTRALSRGIAVLQAINRGVSLSMMEIARTSNLSYPTVTRIVRTLIHEGLVEREPARKRYRPTALVQTLAHGFQGHGRLVQVARRHIVALTREIGWPITLATHVGSAMVLRDSTHALTALTFNSYYPGYRLPILECAAGLVYLAFADPAERDSIMATLRLLPEDGTVHMLDELQAGRLATIRAQGYAMRGNNRFTLNPGKTSSIAAPVFDADGIAGTLTIAYFASAISPAAAADRLAPPLRRTADAISAELAADAGGDPA